MSYFSAILKVHSNIKVLQKEIKRIMRSEGKINKEVFKEGFMIEVKASWHFQNMLRMVLNRYDAFWKMLVEQWSPSVIRHP